MRDIYSANENSSTTAMVPHNGGRCRSKDNCCCEFPKRNSNFGLKLEGILKARLRLKRDFGFDSRESFYQIAKKSF